MKEALRVSNLTKTYSTGLTALNGIDLKVDAGDFFALLGPNGAGKTTTIGIITSLVNKTSGSVSVFGYDTDKNMSKAKSFIGVVPQEFNFNVFEKCFDILVQQAGYYGIAKSKACERAEKYLTRLGLWDKRYQIARTLSGGMKRRLMIARALVHEPQILILDEPTAGVDIELRRSTWAFLQEINAQGITVLLTTHYLEEAEYLCKRVAIINRGSIVENTSVKELLSRLNSETIVLDLKRPLAEVPIIDDCEVKLVDEETIEIRFCKKNSLNDIFAELSRQHIEITSMRNKANRLEELFMQLVYTGQT